MRLLVFLLLLPCVGFGQKHNNIWYFGDSCGIDFNSGNPMVINNSSMFMPEGSASIADSLGNLLFYTNGTTVWNKPHTVMDNGDSLMGTSTSTQTAIIPKPGIEDSIYYVITTDKQPTVTNGLRYSTVDLKYNNGLGRVINKNIVLSSSSTEKVAVVTHSNGYDFWIIAHERDNNTLISYEVDCSGIDTVPIKSSVGEINTEEGGYLKTSPDGSKLALAAAKVVDIFDFNTTTGFATNPLSLPADSLFCEYGVCFSPNNTRLYVGSACAPGGRLVQYDLLAGNANDIINARTILYSTVCNIIGIDTCMTFGGMMNAVDGKLYVAHYLLGFGAGDTMLGVINNPNLLGANCNYVHDGFNLQGRNTLLGMVNLIETDFNYISCGTGVEEIKPSTITIHPNPSTGVFTVQGATGPIAVYDLFGRLVMTNTDPSTGTGSAQLDMSGFPKGVYMVKAGEPRLPGGRAVRKLVLH
jgi:hypothetical protein